MPDRSDLGSRMKKYEAVSNTYLTNKTPVILRIDGRSFHTFTRGFQKPFDEVLVKTMQDTMAALCQNIQNAVLGYTQSDEISIVLVDYKDINTSPWFDNRVQKMSSIAASMATLCFNRAFEKNIISDSLPNNTSVKTRIAYYDSSRKGAMFDCRVFNLPKDEIANYFYWRQEDAIRNSIQMVGQANFSHKELQNKSCTDIKKMLIDNEFTPWEEYPIYLQRGSCCVKNCIRIEYKPVTGDTVERRLWGVDRNIPVFLKDGRDYIESRICL